MKKYQVKYVDSYKIRQELDADFNILHLQRDNPAIGDSKWYIPKGEVWLDYHFKDEEKFLVDMETTEMSNWNRDAYKAKFTAQEDPGDFIIKEEIKDDLKVQLVDGAKVRRHIDPQFVMGGHDLVYSYVPAKTIWLENNLDPRDLPHILKHELLERQLMGQGQSYDDAHGWATAAEKESRRAVGGRYIGDDGHPRILNIKDFYVDATSQKKIED